MSAITVSGLHKSYGDQLAVDDVSFAIETGEVYALLGHNGAGKTTTVEILEGHRHPTAGTVSVLGLDPTVDVREVRDRIGIVLQSSGVESQFTVRETFRFYSSCYRNSRDVDEVIGLVGLAGKADDRVGTLSGGQQRRVDLGLGIIGNPEVLFLDEPTTGFDPVARRQSWGLIDALCAGGTTVLLTTHYLEEAEQLADRVGVLSGGRLVAEGTPAELIGAANVATVTFELPDDAELDGARRPGVAATGERGRGSGAPSSRNADAGHDGVWSVVPSHHNRRAGTVEFQTTQPTADIARLTGWAVERGIELANLTVTRPSLEDVFLELGGEPGGDVG